MSPLRTLSVFAAIGILITAGTVPVACAGVVARDEALLPAMKLAWTGIQRDVERGVADLSAEDAAPVLAQAVAMRDALDSGDRELVAQVDWPVLKFAAEQGITKRVQSGELSPGVAEILMERVTTFDEAYRVLVERIG